MKVVTRHLNKETLIAKGFVLFSLSALFAFFDFVGRLDEIGTRFSAWEVIVLVLLELPSRVYEVMPIAALLGGVFTMSRWAANSEFTILRVSGLSPVKLAMMLAVPGTILVSTTYLLGEFVAPAADKLRLELRNADHGILKARGYSSGVWIKDIARDKDGNVTHSRYVNVSNLVAGQNSKTGAWRVFEFDTKRNLTRVLHAGSASFIPHEGWHLFDSKIESLPKITTDEQTVVSKALNRHNADVLLSSELTPAILGVMTVKPENMGIQDLWQYLKHLKDNRQTTDRYEIALWSKVFYPIAIFVMLAVAMPFAYLNARSGGVSIKIFAGLMIGITFYTLNNLFSFLGVLNTWPPILVAVIPSILMLIIASIGLWFVERR